MRKCSCGEIASMNNFSQHTKRKKHLRLLQDQELIKEEDVASVDTIDDDKIKEEAIQQETIEEPLLQITEESILQRLLTLLR